MTRPRWRRPSAPAPDDPRGPRRRAPCAWLSDRTCFGLALAALALGFVVLGADGLDLGPAEARLGLAAGESVGPMGQVFGYWAPDLWPGEVLPSLVLARLTPASRATSAVVRWPAALAAILGGWILARGMHRSFGYRAAIWAAVCWFGCLARHRSLGRRGPRHDPRRGDAGGDRPLAGPGRDWVAGLWASLAFLAGGWPPLLLIGAGHHRHRPAGLELLRRPGPAAAGDGRRLVDRRPSGPPPPRPGRRRWPCR